jgi:hypothetical protein
LHIVLGLLVDALAEAHFQAELHEILFYLPPQKRSIAHRQLWERALQLSSPSAAWPTSARPNPGSSLATRRIYNFRNKLPPLESECQNKTFLYINNSKAALVGKL